MLASKKAGLQGEGGGRGTKSPSQPAGRETGTRRGLKESARESERRKKGKAFGGQEGLLPGGERRSDGPGGRSIHTRGE